MNPGPDGKNAGPPAGPAKKPWSAGTLTYTSGGLLALFLLLLCGDFALSLRDRSVLPTAQWYLNHLKVPNLVFGLLISSVPALIGLILSPIISVKSDRHRGKRGRRIPFLLVTTPFAALGMIGLGFTPLIASGTHSLLTSGLLSEWLHQMLGGHPAGLRALSMLQEEMVVSVICFAIFWTMFEFATIAGQAVFGGLINDVVPRPLLGRFYGLFRAVSLIDGMIFNFWLIGGIPTHYTVILVVIGIFYGTVSMWVYWNIEEGEYPPPPSPTAPPGAGRAGFLRSFFCEVRQYCRDCFAQPYYLSVFFMLTVAGLSFVAVNTFSIPYALSLGVTMDTYGKAVALTFLISLSLSFFLGWLADIFHPIRMTAIILAGYALVAAWGGFYATTPNTFLAAWVLHGVLSGCYFTTVASLGQRLYPHSKFAQFTSAFGIFWALANMVLVPLIGMLIDRTGNIYRCTFAIGCMFALTALGATWYSYRKFLQLGGPKHYAAP